MKRIPVCLHRLAGRVACQLNVSGNQHDCACERDFLVYGVRGGPLMSTEGCYLRACVCTFSVTGVPERTDSSPRRSAGNKFSGPSTFSPRPPQVSTTFS